MEMFNILVVIFFAHLHKPGKDKGSVCYLLSN